MGRVLLTTIGTSLLTNRDARPWAPWQWGQPLPDADMVAAWLQEADPVLISAESHTLERLDVGATDTLVLLPSDTPEGRFCAEQLAAYYKLLAKEVRQETLRALGYARFAEQGLRSLIDTVFGLYRDYRNLHEIVFVATGGFKSEIAYLNLIGALLQVEVVYIHEQFRELVRLPRLPLTWDLSFIEAQASFFAWIEAEPRHSAEVESWLAREPGLAPLVSVADDGYSYLNAAGVMLYQMVQMPTVEPLPPSEVEPERKDKLSDVDHDRPPGYQRAVKALCALDWVTQVRFEPNERTGSERLTKVSGSGGVIVRYGRGNNFLTLRVAITAESGAQTQWAADYIASHIDLGG